MVEVAGPREICQAVRTHSQNSKRCLATALRVSSSITTGHNVLNKDAGHYVLNKDAGHYVLNKDVDPKRKLKTREPKIVGTSCSWLVAVFVD